jgi:radical SAM protein with 4Fe4S-binding SPASM domain
MCFAMKLHQKRMLNQSKAMASYNLKLTNPPTWPMIASIEITNRCNLHCAFCARDAVKQLRGVGSMSLHNFKSILNRYAKQVWHPRLFLHGEPTLHPDLPDMIHACRMAGADSVGFTTNGLLLDKKLFRRCMVAGVTVVAVSFEGTSRETYESVRGPFYDVVRRNLLDCCRLNAEHDYPVRLSINIIDMNLTHDGLHDFRNEWGGRDGLTGGVTVSQLGDWAGSIDVQRLHDPNGRRYDTVPICPAPWYLVNITWDGGIIPCCSWMGPPFGNIFTDDLLEVWNDYPYMAFRLALKYGRSNHPVCAKCHSNPFPPDSIYLKPNLINTFIVNPIKKKLGN